LGRFWYIYYLREDFILVDVLTEHAGLEFESIDETEDVNILVCLLFPIDTAQSCLDFFIYRLFYSIEFEKCWLIDIGLASVQNFNLWTISENTGLEDN